MQTNELLSKVFITGCDYYWILALKVKVSDGLKRYKYLDVKDLFTFLFYVKYKLT